MFDGLVTPYDCIVADPPWRFRSNRLAKPGRNACRHYQCMDLNSLAALPVEDLAGDDCALFLWVPGPLLVIGAHIPIMQAWGFKPTAMAFVWIKTNPDSSLFMGAGFTTRKNAEYCLLGKRGRSVRADAGVHEVILSPRRQHSRKPPEFMQRVRRYVGLEARIAELFARERVPGIDAWGDEPDRFTTTTESTNDTEQLDLEAYLDALHADL